MRGRDGGSAIKNPLVMQDQQEVRARSLGQEDNVEEETDTHSSVLA